MENSNYTIRAARPPDLPLLAAIEQAAAALFHATAYPELAAGPFITAEADLTHELAWVVVDATDQPVGFVIARVLADSVHIHELDVHPQHARQRLGWRLIQEAAAWARAQDVAALTLTTFADVPWNGPYYTRLGFCPLDEAATTPAMREILQAEEAAGLPMARRICMRLAL